MPREFSRNLRVGAELQRLLNELLQTEVKDPRLAGVRVHEVELSRDLGVAKVYFGMLEPERDVGPVEEGLDKARGYLRSRAAAGLSLRRMPELRFIHDVSAERGLELSRLIERSARGAGPEEGHGGPDSAPEE